MSKNKVDYQSPIVGEIEFAAEAPVASSKYGEFGDDITGSDFDFGW